jgi:hypothetical protein
MALARPKSVAGITIPERSVPDANYRKSKLFLSFNKIWRRECQPKEVEKATVFRIFKFDPTRYPTHLVNTFQSLENVNKSNKINKLAIATTPDSCHSSLAATWP